MKTQFAGLKIWSLGAALVLPLVLPLVLAVSVAGCSAQDPFLTIRGKNKQEKVSDKASRISFNPRVDILFVIDDSGSMSDKQANIIANAEPFIDEFVKYRFLDFHIGVVTSSMYSSSYGHQKGGAGKLVGTPPLMYIDRKTPNGLQVFQENVDCGTSGDATEKFFDPVYAALTPPLVNGYNAGFFRADAHLATIFVTDAEDQSVTMKSAAQFYGFLVNTLKGGDAKKVHSYAVFIPSSDNTCNRSGEDKPKLIEELLKMSNGLSFDLCDPLFGLKLAGIGQDLAGKVGKIIYLTRPPDPNTLVVSYGSQVLPSDKRFGWSFDPKQNAILLGDDIQWSIQPEGTLLQVDFTSAVYE